MFSFSRLLAVTAASRWNFRVDVEAIGSRNRLTQTTDVRRASSHDRYFLPTRSSLEKSETIVDTPISRTPMHALR